MKTLGFCFVLFLFAMNSNAFAYSLKDLAGTYIQNGQASNCPPDVSIEISSDEKNVTVFEWTNSPMMTFSNINEPKRVSTSSELNALTKEYTRTYSSKGFFGSFELVSEYISKTYIGWPVPFYPTQKRSYFKALKLSKNLVSRKAALNVLVEKNGEMLLDCQFIRND